MEEVEEEEGALIKVGDWEIYAADDGKPYFFNVESNQTQWEIPPELEGNQEVMSLMIEEEAAEEEEEEGQYEATGEDNEEIKEIGDEDGSEWGEAVDEETGRIYYYSHRDGRTTWDKPQGYRGKQLTHEEVAEEGEDEEGEVAEMQEGEVEDLEEGELEEGELEEEEEEEEEAWGQQATERWTRGVVPISGDKYFHEQAYIPPMQREPDSAMVYKQRQQQQHQEEPQHGGARRYAPGSEDRPEAASENGPATSIRSTVVEKRDVIKVDKEEDSKREKKEATVALQVQQQQQQQREKQEEEEPSVTSEVSQATPISTVLEEAQARLKADDSIMDPGIVEAVLTYINEYTRLVESGELSDTAKGANVTELLASSYKGYANMSILLAGWLQNLSGDGTEQDLDANSLVLDHLKGQVKSNFDLEKADALLFGRKQDMTFIDDMMEYKRWRRLLMEIFAEHKASKLLGGYCMQHMSRAGHNTEMADTISVTDYWSVARGVLTELLADVPWADHIHLWRLLTNLKRICCSTAYLHAFSQQLLKYLEEELLKEASMLEAEEEEEMDQEGRHRLKRRGKNIIVSARKYRRIREELEKTCLEEVGSQDRSRNRFVQKLCVWQNTRGPEDESRRKLVEVLFESFCDGTLSARVLTLLQEVYVEQAIFEAADDGRRSSCSDAFRTTHEEDEQVEARVKGPLEFLRHPQLLDLLVKAIFDPKERYTTESQRQAVYKILVVASCALLDGAVDPEEARALYRKLREASDLLAKEEILLWNMPSSSIPPTLLGLCGQPVIAMGFLHWLRETIQDPEFHNSRQFNEVMQVFMRLLQSMVVEHPLHQPAIFAAIKALMLLKPTESSFNIIRMKRQALQCCVFLMSHGFVLPVINFLHGSLAEGMDHALIRHFVGLTMIVARPPYSSLFANAMATFLREVVVSKALKSNMEDGHRRALRRFIEECSSEESTLLDPAMKKGLRLVYSYLLPNPLSSMTLE